MSKKPTALRPSRELLEIYTSTPPEDTIHFIIESLSVSKGPGNHPDRAENDDISQTPPKSRESRSLDTKPKQAYKDIDEVRNLMHQFSKTLRPKICDLITQPHSPTWCPPGVTAAEVSQFYEQLKIPTIKSKPNLLLHNLGKISNPYINKLLAGENHKILCNTSGSGKTRLLLETLCHHWGFYFVVAQGNDGIGSPDLQMAIHLMRFSSCWRKDIFKSSSSGRPSTTEIRAASLSNEDIAFKKLSKVILSRRLVFLTFINVVKELNNGTIPNSAKLDWLLLQILPDRFLPHSDPFSSVVNTCLTEVAYKDLEKLNEEFDPAHIPGLNLESQGNKFLFAIDEIQVAGQQYLGSFCDAKGEVQRPVLRPIVGYLVLNKPNARIIASGTEFSLENFKVAVPSQVGKESLPWDVEHQTGDFDAQQGQMDYISVYLPFSFLSSTSGTRLRGRMYEWLRGRHRFTASYLEELIRRPWKASEPTSPHKLFNAYVSIYTDFNPRDGDITLLNQEEDLTLGLDPIRIDGFPWDHIIRAPGLLEELASSIDAFTTQGKLPMWDATRREFVESGLARFFIEKDIKIKIVEPLALASIIRYFESKNLSLPKTIRERLQNDQEKAFEGIVLLTITRLFQDGQKLSNVFDFYKSIPAWADRTATIVAQASSGDFRKFDLLNELNLLSVSVASHAEGPDEVKSWIEIGNSGWCIPGNYMGPDLMTWLRLDDGKALLLLIQAKCHSSGDIDTVSADVIGKAIRSLIPDNFFISLNARNPQAKLKVTEMLEGINKPSGGAFTGCTYNILRVITSVPQGINVNSSSSHIQSVLREDDHPLASFSRTVLTSTLATIPYGTSILGDLTNKLEGNRLEKRGNTDTSEHRAKRQKIGDEDVAMISMSI